MNVGTALGSILGTQAVPVFCGLLLAHWIYLASMATDSATRRVCGHGAYGRVRISETRITAVPGIAVFGEFPRLAETSSATHKYLIFNKLNKSTARPSFDRILTQLGDLLWVRQDYRSCIFGGWARYSTGHVVGCFGGRRIQGTPRKVVGRAKRP